MFLCFLTENVFAELNEWNQIFIADEIRMIGLIDFHGHHGVRMDRMLPTRFRFQKGFRDHPPRQKSVSDFCDILELPNINFPEISRADMKQGIRIHE